MFHVILSLLTFAGLSLMSCDSSEKNNNRRPVSKNVKDTSKDTDIQGEDLDAGADADNLDTGGTDDALPEPDAGGSDQDVDESVDEDGAGDAGNAEDPDKVKKQPKEKKAEGYKFGSTGLSITTEAKHFVSNFGKDNISLVTEAGEMWQIDTSKDKPEMEKKEATLPILSKRLHFVTADEFVWFIADEHLGRSNVNLSDKSVTEGLGQELPGTWVKVPMEKRTFFDATESYFVTQLDETIEIYSFKDDKIGVLRPKWKALEKETIKAAGVLKGEAGFWFVTEEKILVLEKADGAKTETHEADFAMEMPKKPGNILHMNFLVSINKDKIEVEDGIIVTDKSILGFGLDPEAEEAEQVDAKITFADVRPISDQFCIACHADTLDTEEKWIADKDSIKKHVEENTMPPPDTAPAKDITQAEKDTIVKWIEQLDEEKPEDGNNGDGNGDGTPPPVDPADPNPAPPTEIPAATAALIQTNCVNCHAQSNTLAWWNARVADNRNRITSGNMPQGSTLNAADKQTFLDFVNSLEE